MRYSDFRDSICKELRESGEGLTWKEIRDRLKLPYGSPCPEWVHRMEEENGLVRTRGAGRAYIWRIGREMDDEQDRG